jgi:CheY-like chemotaxis protein
VANEERYEVSCFNCKARFDALKADFCDCLTKDRTFVCPTCSNCFCKAPTPFKHAFWAKAPQSMWDRKMNERRTYGRGANEAPEKVKRPLVLVVDDEEEIRAVAKEKIEGLGFGVILATNGEEGLALARDYKPELVLSDAMMPKLDGREMGRLIKDSPETANIKVVIMTSLYTAPRYKYEAMKEFQADEYVAKPLDFQQLEKLLHRFLV